MLKIKPEVITVKSIMQGGMERSCENTLAKDLKDLPEKNLTFQIHTSGIKIANLLVT